MQTRALAALIINEVIIKQTALSFVLERHLKQITDTKDRAFVQELCYGVLRWQPQLNTCLNIMLNKPMKSKDQDVRALLWLGLYQIRHQRTPEHAAVSATVDACLDLKKPWAKGIINALLRRFIREQEQFDKVIEQDQVGKYSHPDWILEKLKKDWPEDWEDILENNQQRPPLTLRVNKKNTDRSHYSKTLNTVRIEHILSDQCDSALTLTKPCDVIQLPGYEKGDFSVQDQAAQLAAGLLDLQSGQRVLDACAAPGGKTAHILEQNCTLQELIALDNDPLRLDRVHENLKRLGLSAQVCSGDASRCEEWWDGTLFDRILLDVPCTASGIIRRHPDIKLLRQAGDLTALAELQKNILDNIWPLLRPQGKLVYSTCSVFKQENELQIEHFIQRHQDAKLQTINADWGMDRNYGRQILPGQENMDGFFYACLLKS